MVLYLIVCGDDGGRPLVCHGPWRPFGATQHCELTRQWRVACEYSAIHFCSSSVRCGWSPSSPPIVHWWSGQCSVWWLTIWQPLDALRHLLREEQWLVIC